MDLGSNNTLLTPGKKDDNDANYAGCWRAPMAAGMLYKSDMEITRLLWNDRPY
jgi:hypothetical protein